MSVVKRSVMTLYASLDCVHCHRVRIALAEKAMSVEVVMVNPANPPEALLKINPYGSTPTLVDRELVLYHHAIIEEYLDERFPHPPLMPVYPVARAKSRLMIHRFEKDWYSLFFDLRKDPNDQEARQLLLDSLIGLAPVFADTPYFLSEEFTLVDCCIAPLLWRLASVGIEVPAKFKSIHAYMQRVFSRPSFKQSLVEYDRVMQD